MISDHYKRQTTTAKRTATTLLALADTTQDAEAKGILLAASRVVSQIARESHARHQEEARKEAAYAAAMKRLVPEAAAKIKADWPMQTTLQRMALIATHTGAVLLPLSADRIERNPSINFKSELDYAIGELASSIAHAAYSSKTTIADAICKYARLCEAMYSHITVKECAERIDACLAQPEAA